MDTRPELVDCLKLGVFMDCILGCVAIKFIGTV